MPTKVEIEADDRLSALTGATILRVGKPTNLACEGGGLAFEYLPPGSDKPALLVIEFNELGLWLSRRAPSGLK